MTRASGDPDADAADAEHLHDRVAGRNAGQTLAGHVMLLRDGGIQLSASPLATLLNGLDPTRAEPVVNAIVADVEVALADYSGTDGLAFPQEAHVLLAVA